ncbi:MAG: efflux RND transporter periplasmic adaptor subunit [Deltaproteobacteria bacterium]|nr:efflux RND transporter periplasmic adaptor subunit [Deltaproteobacteria bacterium]
MKKYLLLASGALLAAALLIMRGVHANPEENPHEGHEGMMHDHEGMMHENQHETPPETPKKDEKEQKLYTCPMHPQIRKTEPGQCPICGMDLIPVKEQEDLPQSSVPGFATIRVTPEQQWLIGVKTATVEKRELLRKLRTYGTVASDRELYVTQKEYLAAVRSKADTLIRATHQKLLLLGMTESQIKALRKEGEVDSSLYLTIGTGKAWIYSAIYESERPLIREELPITIETAGDPKRGFTGKIDAITPLVNPENRTLTARTEVQDPEGILQPGMFLDVYIDIPLGESLTIPKSAVLKTGQRNIVMVQKDPGIFEPREVTLGGESDEMLQVLSGLNEGEIVVTSANFLLDSESQIRGAFSSGAGGHQHGQ